jgi:ACT domain-containing protein
MGALLAAAFTVLTLWALKYVEQTAFSRKGTVLVEMQIRNEPGQLAAVLSPLVELGCTVKDVQMEHSEDEWIGLELTLKLPQGIDAQQTKQRISAVPGVKM